MKSLKPPKPKAINFELIPPLDGIHEPAQTPAGTKTSRKSLVDSLAH